MSEFDPLMTRRAFPRNFFFKWFFSFGRRFPWREDRRTPFNFLLTEMLLRQTRAENVAPLWEEFVTTYPNPLSILHAPRTELVSRLRPLGLVEQRVDALKAVADVLQQSFGGAVPDELEALLGLPHVGEYTARALLCFSFGRRTEVVDTNVLRLFSRVFGLPLGNDNRRAPLATKIARHILPRSGVKVRFHNYGMLDFAAQICRSRGPKCQICPIARQCVSNDLSS